MDIEAEYRKATPARLASRANMAEAAPSVGTWNSIMILAGRVGDGEEAHAVTANISQARAIQVCNGQCAGFEKDEGGMSGAPST